MATITISKYANELKHLILKDVVIQSTKTWQNSYFKPIPVWVNRRKDFYGVKIRTGIEGELELLKIRISELCANNNIPVKQIISKFHQGAYSIIVHVPFYNVE